MTFNPKRRKLLVKTKGKAGLTMPGSQTTDYKKFYIPARTQTTFLTETTDSKKFYNNDPTGTKMAQRPLTEEEIEINQKAWEPTERHLEDQRPSDRITI